MTKEKAAQKIQDAVGSLESLSVVLKVKQAGVEVELAVVSAVPSDDGGELLAEVETRGGVFGAMIAAYLLRKAEEAVLATARQEVSDERDNAGQPRS